MATIIKLKCHFCETEFKMTLREYNKYRRNVSSNLDICSKCLTYYYENRTVLKYKCITCGCEFDMTPVMAHSRDLTKLTVNECSRCAYKSCVEKRKATCLEKYGVENPGQCPEIIERNKKHFLEKYGVENPGQAPEIKQKIHKTFLEKYGVEYVLQNPDIQHKQEQTCLQRYGETSALRVKNLRIKVKKHV